MTEYKKQIAAYENRSADEKYLFADHTNVSAVKTCHLAVQTNHLAVHTNHCAVFLNHGVAAALVQLVSGSGFDRRHLTPLRFSLV